MGKEIYKWVNFWWWHVLRRKWNWKGATCKGMTRRTSRRRWHLSRNFTFTDSFCNGHQTFPESLPSGERVEALWRRVEPTDARVIKCPPTPKSLDISQQSKTWKISEGIWVGSVPCSSVFWKRFKTDVISPWNTWWKFTDETTWVVAGRFSLDLISY